MMICCGDFWIRRIFVLALVPLWGIFLPVKVVDFFVVDHGECSDREFVSYVSLGRKKTVEKY
jgi:hypothetical protein